ncbi:MAG: hypothetical protein H6936_14585 [Burkholderiales bacterium]|nr:hypothetical protein [Burkholderiales bacterium]
MKCSLSERVSKREQDKPGRKNKHLPAFLALKNEINQALADGWSMYQIWSTLRAEQRLGCSYVWFRNLCQKHLTDTSRQPQHSAKPVKTPAGVSQEDSFTFSSTINKEDLI